MWDNLRLAHEQHTSSYERLEKLRNATVLAWQSMRKALGLAIKTACVVVASPCCPAVDMRLRRE